LYRITDPETRLRWLIGTQTFRIVLFAVGEVVAFLVIVGYVVSYMVCRCLQLNTAPAMLIPHRQFETRCSHAYSQPQATDSSQASHRPGLRILTFRNIILRVGESIDEDKYTLIIRTCAHSPIPNRLMRAQHLHGRDRLV
jgi:hypothetical protein